MLGSRQRRSLMQHYAVLGWTKILLRGVVQDLQVSEMTTRMDMMMILKKHIRKKMKLTLKDQCHQWKLDSRSDSDRIVAL